MFHFKKNKRERALYDGYKFEKEGGRSEEGAGEGEVSLKKRPRFARRGARTEKNGGREKRRTM